MNSHGGSISSINVCVHATTHLCNCPHCSCMKLGGIYNVVEYFKPNGTGIENGEYTDEKSFKIE